MTSTKELQINQFYQNDRWDSYVCCVQIWSLFFANIGMPSDCGLVLGS